MTTYQTLCELYQQQQAKHKSFEQRLRDEVQIVANQLAITLGLQGKTYRQNISDEQATQPYVFVGKMTFRDTQEVYPTAMFDLNVVLEEDVESYPKKSYAQRIEIGFIQADRLYFRFVEARPEVRLAVNLGDDDELKYRGFITAYLDLLTKILTKGS